LHQKEGQEKQDKRSLTLENIRKNLEELSKKRTKGFDGLRGKSEKTASGKLELNQLLYKTILETIWTDVSCMIEFQKKIIARKKAALGVPDSVAEQLEKEIKQKFWEKINLEFAPSSEEEEDYDRNRIIYNSILEAVLVDGDITEKKKLYLKKKREELNISDEDVKLPEIEMAPEAKISIPSTEDIIEPPEIKPRERSGRIEVKKAEPEARLIAKEEFQRRAKEDLRKAAEEERKKELRLTWMEKEDVLAHKDASVEAEESERELIKTEDAKKEAMRRKWMAEEEALATEDVPAPESSEEEMAKLAEEESARQAEEEESKRLEEEKRLAEEFAKKAEEELARAEEEARLEEEAKKEAMRRKWMAEEEALSTENETGEVAPREIEEEMERLAEEEELKRIEEEKRLAEEFAKQAEEELARAEEEARLAEEEEAKKEALRQKWMAEEEALATDAPGEAVSQKSGEEARKEALRQKWMAEEEALATEDVPESESSEEEMARLAEEEFARQAEEELARAEEEARLAEEEEARKEALRQKWMAEEEALATEDVPESESSEEEMARLAEEEFARQAEEELARAEEEARLAEEEARKEALRQKWMAEEEALAQQQGIAGKPVVPGVDEKMCPNCGKILRLKSKFCNGCGMDVRNFSITQSLPLNPPGLAEEEAIREEELARQAEEELRRAEEEARRLVEEEARRDEEKLRKLEEELLKSGTKGQLQDDMNCPNCGKKLRWGAKFCNGCGTDLSFLSSDQETSASYLPEDYKEDKKKK